MARSGGRQGISPPGQLTQCPAALFIRPGQRGLSRGLLGGGADRGAHERLARRRAHPSRHRAAPCRRGACGGLAGLGPWPFLPPCALGGGSLRRGGFVLEGHPQGKPGQEHHSERHQEGSSACHAVLRQT
ncbi:hypothetical protein D187_003867 [Cystobacter fuscus DSM 2262]|uniref:Uncharacterized protein n=1 Tax=Cystobacter fuscus (strain ATCC 25194 / DSM 2262 / NBRC 100088 / M29) TaxID=1242864 RepID=S9QBI9_CYSF2|nr:hypothetical protein D187_003867 [Cystobacter fuscus DSM 2262]